MPPCGSCSHAPTTRMLCACNIELFHNPGCLPGASESLCSMTIDCNEYTEPGIFYDVWYIAQNKLYNTTNSLHKLGKFNIQQCGNLYTFVRPNQEQMWKMQGITCRNRTWDEVINLGWWPTIKKYKMQTNSVLAFQMHFRALRTLNDLKLFGKTNLQSSQTPAFIIQQIYRSDQI
jgi:hypothetical protein